jgi:hypothetical protein
MLATPELGHRLISYHREIGLSPDRLQQVIDTVRDWRAKYIEFAEAIVSLGNAIDKELHEYDVDLNKVMAMLQRRLDLMAQAEKAFVDAWMSLHKLITRDEHVTLQQIYHREFRKLPHPVLGSPEQTQLMRASI